MKNDENVPDGHAEKPNQSFKRVADGLETSQGTPKQPASNNNRYEPKNRKKPILLVRFFRIWRKIQKSRPPASTAEKLTVFVTFVIALTGGVQACIYRQEKAIMESSSRPYVGVAQITPSYNKEAKATDVVATINNFGARPAFDLSATWTGLVNGKRLPALGQAQEPFTLFPKRPVFLQSRFSADDWERIASGQDQLIYRISIKYRFAEDAPLTTHCEEDEYMPLGNAFFPEACKE
jgi:hypothetical protein